MLANPALGAKHTCASCCVRFYDLNKRPVSCPKCRHIQVPVKKRAVRRRRVAGESAVDKNITTQYNPKVNGMR